MTSQLPSIALGDFSRDGFSITGYLGGLCKEALSPGEGQSGPKPDTATPAAAARASIDVARALILALDKAESQAQSAHAEICKSVATLQGKMATEEARYQKALSSSERQSEGVREAFRDLEERANRVAGVGTRLGDRLQRADTLRARALELVTLLSHLQLFAHLPDGDSAFSGGQLPPLFREDSKLAEAAVVARKLRALTADVESARQRSRLAGEGGGARPGSGGGGGGGGGLDSTPSRRELALQPGSLEYCAHRLERYCVWLEGRVVSRFDRAADDDNVRVMGECARIMANFDREKALLQRYIGLLPAFQSSLDALPWVREPAVTADDAAVAERLRPLSRLFSTLGETVEMEASRMAAIFPDLRGALNALAAKVFEDRVEMALERLLEDTAEDAFSGSSSEDEDGSGSRGPGGGGDGGRQKGDLYGGRGGGGVRRASSDDKSYDEEEGDFTDDDEYDSGRESGSYSGSGGEEYSGSSDGRRRRR